MELTLTAQKVKAALSQAVLLPEYQKGFLGNFPDGEPKTACNLLARDFLDSTCPKTWKCGWLIGSNPDARVKTEISCYDISMISPDDIVNDVLNTTIQRARENLINAAKQGLVELMTAEEAQRRANAGLVIHCISGKHNHELIICPDENPYDPNKGPKIGQAGLYNAICYISDSKSFGKKWTDPDLIYVQYPKKSMR